MILLYMLGIVAGIASTTQASYNGRIREIIRSPYITACMSFIVSSAIMAVTILATEGDMYIPLSEIAKNPPWIWLGGTCGMIIIITNVLCLPKLGSARNVMIVCFGQVMTGLVIDHFGLFGAPYVTMTVRRLAGAVLVLIGVALMSEIRKKAPAAASDGAVSDPDGSGGPGTGLYIMLALVDGFACAAQVAINGSLRVCAGSASKATLISMQVGLISTLIVIALITVFKGRTGIYDGGQREPWPGKLRPWMIMGGLMAVIVVGGNAVIAPLVGTGIVTVMNLVGMMGSALVIDAIGFLGIEVKPVTVSKITGMLLMIAGTAIISL